MIQTRTSHKQSFINLLSPLPYTVSSKITSLLKAKLYLLKVNVTMIEASKQTNTNLSITRPDPIPFIPFASPVKTFKKLVEFTNYKVENNILHLSIMFTDYVQSLIDKHV